MSYLRPAFFQFYQDLVIHNDSEWFKANQKLYEQEVKRPFLALLEDLIQAFQVNVYPHFKIPAKDLVYRINRDIRFSKDKTPYKTHSGAHINPRGKQSEYPGLYLQAGAEGCFFGGGCYMISPPSLYKIRQEIAYHTTEWEEIIQNPVFQEHYGTVQGERLKSMPRDFKEETCEWIKNKQFYLWKSIPPEAFYQDGIIQTLTKEAEASVPLLRFLERGFE